MHSAVVAFVALPHAWVHLSAIAEFVNQPSATSDETVLAVVLEDSVHRRFVHIEPFANGSIRMRRGHFGLEEVLN